MAYDRNLISNGSPMEELIGFSRAVRVGPFISVGGTAAVDAAGKTVGVGDVAAQTRQCIEIIGAALEKAGSGLHDVVRLRILLTDIADWKAAVEVRKAIYSVHAPKGRRPYHRLSDRCAEMTLEQQARAGLQISLVGLHFE